MATLQLRQMDGLKRALSEGTRTEENNAPEVAKRFVPLRTGIESKLSSKRSQLLAGRRGTGKSTLLYVVRKKLEDSGTAVASIDMEQFKGREFPDVLIEILRDLLKAISPGISVKHLRRDLGLWRRRSALVAELTRTLNDPQRLTKTISRTATRAGKARAAVVVKSPIREVPIDGSAAVSAEKASTTTAVAEYEELKIQRLQQLAPELVAMFTDTVRTTKSKSAIFFIDDYSYVSLSDQPYVLDYLQQVTKGTGVHLKIGGIGTRLRPHIPGDPPIGMEPDHDVDRLVLDVTLEDFTTAKAFVENVLDGIAEPFGLSSADMFTEIARDRMVLACGGAVARDYINLTDSALDEAMERLAKKGKLTDDSVIRVESVDVHRAVRKRVNTKETESLDLDAATDKDRLAKRWRDVCDFAREAGDTAFVLFKVADLDGTEWGAEIQELDNLRLLHRIAVTSPNTPSLSGLKVVVYMIDLGQIANQRLSKGIIEFWKGTAESDKLRRKAWIYEPDWHAKKLAREAERHAADLKKLVRSNPKARSKKAPGDGAESVAMFDL